MRPVRQICLLSLVLATPLGAQVRPQDSTVIRLAPVTVTATLAPQPVAAPGLAITIRDAAWLRITHPSGVADALADVPGVFVDRAVGPAGPAILRLRGGEEVFTQVLIDGVQVNQNGGFFDLAGLDLTGIERFEVVRGPQSALYGSSAVSGVVQALSPALRPGPTRVAVRSEGTRAEGLDEGWALRGTVRGGGAVRWLAGGGARTARGPRALAHDLLARDGVLRVDADPAGWLAVSTVLRVADVSSALPVRDPGSTRAPLDPNAENQRTRVIGSVRADARLTARWTQRLTLAVYHERFRYEDAFDGVPDTLPFFVFDANFGLRSNLTRTTATWVSTHEHLAGPALAASWGFQVEREQLTDSTDGDFGAGTLGLDRNGGAGFGEVRLGGERVRGLLGARVEQVAGTPWQATPRASLEVTVTTGLALRAAAGRAWKAPNLQQRYLDNPFIAANADLRPESSWSIEGGLRLAAGPLTVDVTAFRQDYRDLIRTVALDTTGRQINRNLGASRASGVEGAVRIALPWARLPLMGVDGAAIRTTIEDNVGLSPDEFPVGGALPFRPTHNATAFADLLPTAGLRVRLRADRVGPQTVLTERFSGARATVGGYWLAGVTVTLQARGGADVWARVDNLFDTGYATAWDQPGARRTVRLGLDLSV